MGTINVPTEGRPAKRPECRLAGEDGNAFAIMGRVTEALRRAGASKAYRDAYFQEATASDYDHLLCASVAYLEAGGWDLNEDEDEDEDEDGLFDYVMGLRNPGGEP